MNALPEKPNLELSEECALRHIELNKLQTVLKRLNAQREILSRNSISRHTVTRWKALGYDRQHPAQNKSGRKIKRPHA